ncbi:hypothetical protein KW530_21600 [Vibrio fluvialis]|nr:hypothetical protein [Vibrio fluvialis]MBY7942442.1 hypothetical protein [Vibrio fluvialis]MBY8169453.1 hypothetical protein [Vibrio fluvialis]MBY8259297.1 hypothetical protein [Vibrio fluvialis]MBY8267697.1 hypothetical protein [Vibrio fluvialis]
MTIDIRTVSTMDVFKENETYNLSESSQPLNLKIAAIRWLLSSRNHLEARILVLRLIFNLIVEKLPGLRLWCVVGDSAWQSDTRIIRHRKLFKRLKARGVEISHANNFVEELIECDGKLKFFGAAQLSELAIESVVNLMAEESCSYLIAVPDEFGIHALISRGWSSSGPIDTRLLCNIVENNGLVLKVVGAFDDPESGFVGMGKPEQVKTLAQ